MRGSSPLIMASAQGASRTARPAAAAEDLKDANTVQQAVCERTVELVLGTHGGNLKAIILTGSLARQEGTFVREAGGWKQFGDAEFLLVFEDEAALPFNEGLLNLRRSVESELLARGLQCKISLAAVRSKYLRQLRPHIFAYELLTHGRVLWGEPVLSSIPRFLPTAIPLEDAWRLLCNRMIELLEVSVGITDELREVPKEVFYQSVKLYIDMGTSFLVFAGGYEPTYAGRAERMQSLQAQGSAATSCPLNLAQFAERVVACTQYKLSGAARLQLPHCGEDLSGLALWKEAVADAHLLWRWELSQLTGTKRTLTDRELTGRWMRQQPVKEQLRGWLFVLRREGWHRSWRKWLGWARCALRGSPRYCVYAAASELFFKMPTLVAKGSETGAGESAVRDLLGWLPAHRATSQRTLDWRHDAGEIVWNYHLFLVGTRS
jgi:hypothetical protein